MKRTFVFAFLVALILSFAYASNAQDETHVVTRTAGTDWDGYALGSPIIRPPQATAIIFTTVTTNLPGAACDFHLNLRIANASLGKLTYLAAAWSATVVGVGIQSTIFTPNYYWAHYTGETGDTVDAKEISLPSVVYLYIDHANAEVATYSIYYQWVMR